MNSHKHIAYIGLGSNLGDAKDNLKNAVAALEGLPGVSLAAVSGVYETEPQGDPDQPWFANQAAEISVAASITPLSLLNDLLQLETRLGRIRDASRRFGPRAIDIDLLLFDQAFISTPELTLPHPRMTERAFVLLPLREISPNLIIPNGKPIAKLLAQLPYRLKGNKIYQS